MKPARVVAVCSSTSWSGTEKWVLRACEGLAARGRQVVLVTRPQNPFGARRTSNLPLVHLPLRNEADVG
ncbi:MAG: hypothetical protein KAY24_18760, partial [Candidatus Eisenbacteria sp.]|nr:hypothetical protein [Candidatus Eisenbacteria bacterium]